MRRAEVRQPYVRFIRDPLLERGRNARLSDARLSREQSHLPITGFRSLPAAQQKLDLLLAPNQRGHAGRVQRLEPALHRAFAKDLPGGYRLGEALGLDRTQIAILEEITNKPARA